MHLVSCILCWIYISFMMVSCMDVSCTLLVSFILLYFVSWIRGGWCNSIITNVYSFSLSYPVTCIVDDWEFHISFAKRHSEQMYNMDIGLSNYSFMWMWYFLDLVLFRLNVIQHLGILKKCNLLCMFTVDCMLLLPLLCDWCVWLSFLLF